MSSKAFECDKPFSCALAFSGEEECVWCHFHTTMEKTPPLLHF